MEDIYLVVPMREHGAQIFDYKDEFLRADSSMDGCGALRSAPDMDTYFEMTRRMEHAQTVPAGRVPATALLCIRRSDGRLLGMLQIRHMLNDHLRSFGGHIGYSVRPSERRRGYATRMLALALPIARTLGLRRVLITCDEDNIASEKTILHNGGVYENTLYYEEEGVNVKRFWIDLGEATEPV